MPYSIMTYINVIFHYQVQSYHKAQCNVTTAFRDDITVAAYTEADREVGNALLETSGLLLDGKLL
jgi:tryptophan synthase alpha subunit